MKEKILNVIESLLSMKAAMNYVLLFAIAIGVATFIENDFGTSAAQKVIFRARWFELLLFLFCAALCYNVWKKNMIQAKKWATLTFHLSVIIILIGSAITRYIGYEGMMHIRENSSNNYFLSAETFLNFDIRHKGKTYSVNEPVLFASLGSNSFTKRYKIDDSKIKVQVLDFIPNPGQVMEDDAEGKPTLKVVFGGAGGREEYFLQEGDQLTIRSVPFNFTDTPSQGAVNLRMFDGRPEIMSPKDMTVMQMATQMVDTVTANNWSRVLLRSLYSDGKSSFVFGEFSSKAKINVVSTGIKMKSESVGALSLLVEKDDQVKSTMISGQKGVEGRARSVIFDDTEISISYGAKRILLPFSLELRDFQMERYPGTNSASSYASEVTLIDPRKNLNKDYRIYMNNILNYGGYRFFQSSFDQDELGTYLSVNHDFWGTWVSYLGYILLTLGMIATLFTESSRFRWLAQNLKKMRASASIVLLLLIGNLTANAQSGLPVVPESHATKFAELVVQDHRGRLKPVHTMASEILRKVSRSTKFDGLSAEQVFLSMNLFPDLWVDAPIIKLGSHEKILDQLGTSEEYISYKDFFNETGEYKIQNEVRVAHNMNSIDRTIYEKELIKIDERLNIVNLVLNQSFIRLFPIEGDKNNTWVSPDDIRRPHGNTDIIYAPFVEQFFPLYQSVAHASLSNGDWNIADQMLTELSNYQKAKGSAVIPSDTKINAEILLNRSRVFSQLGKYYGLFGFALLLVFFITVFRHDLNVSWIFKVLLGLVAMAFVAHTLGLGIRWYVSGRAPWSNGYESMIYIAFTTMLAGLIFARKSIGGLAATSILASIILMVASLSYLDPEITPLVPVLKSYWLTIHVSLVAGSYGFLMLGAIIGVINLLLMTFSKVDRLDRIKRNITELTLISEMTLVAGLFMLAIGTYLGGVWANESWGRYWGWDAKETWALVTILVYTFILHMRFIPDLRGNYAFNVASLFGFASVVMTYFGVNYYLSGLHSYAAGDPVPVPGWVYYTSAALVLLSIAAWWRQRKIKASLSSQQ